MITGYKTIVHWASEQLWKALSFIIVLFGDYVRNYQNCQPVRVIILINFFIHNFQFRRFSIIISKNVLKITDMTIEMTAVYNKLEIRDMIWFMEWQTIVKEGEKKVVWKHNLLKKESLKNKRIFFKRKILLVITINYKIK